MPSPDATTLDELVEGYAHITGDLVRSQKKINLIAACYRVHGDAFLPLVERHFTGSGTAANLLGIIRRLAPAPNQLTAQDSAEGDDIPLPPIPALAPGLTYPVANPPAFDGRSTRRYDRRPSNPAAAGFFPDCDVESRAPSPTERALSR